MVGRESLRLGTGRVVAFGLIASFCAFGSVRAQSGVPGLPSPQEIERRVREEVEKLPLVRVEDEVFAIAYRRVPLDPQAVVERVVARAAGRLPQGIDPQQAAKQLLPMARPYIERAYAEIGTLEVRVPVKYRSGTLPAGEYVLGLVMKGELPVGLLLNGAKLRGALRIPFRNARAKRHETDLKLEIEVVDRKRGKRNIVAWFNDVEARAGKFTPRTRR